MWEAELATPTINADPEHHDRLWASSGVFLFSAIWTGSRSSVRHIWIIIAPLLAIGGELAQAVRVILTELNRIASHLLWLGTHALDIGAITPVFYCLREREEALKIFERLEHPFVAKVRRQIARWRRGKS